MNWANLLRSQRLSFAVEESSTAPGPVLGIPSSQLTGHHPVTEVGSESTSYQGSIESTTSSLFDSLRIMPKAESPSLLDVLRENAGVLTAVAGWALVLLMFNVGKFKKENLFC